MVSIQVNEGVPILIYTDSDDFFAIADFVESESKKYTVIKPVKPRPPSSTAKPEDFRKYADEFEVFEKKMVDYRVEYNKSVEWDKSLNSQLIDIVKSYSGLNSLDIPDWQKNKLYSYAYKSGHSSGIVEVYYYLLDIIDLFTKD